MFYTILGTVVVGLIIYKVFQLLKPPKPLWSPKWMGEYGEQSRRLGKMERVMAAGGEKGVITLSNALVIRSKIPLTETIVRKALLGLVQRQPLLRMRLGREGGKLAYMKEMQEFKLKLKVCKNAEWQEVMENNLHHSFDVEQGPLWEVNFIPESNYNDGQQADYPYQAVCLFVFHHVITDGTSYGKLFNNFLTNLQQLLDGNELPETPSMTLLPPVDAYVDNSLTPMKKNNVVINFIEIITSFPFIVKMMINHFMMKVPIFIKNLGLEVDRNPNVTQRTAVVPIELTKEQTSKVLIGCKKHKVTVHCAIQTAAALAYLKMAEGGEVKETHDITTGPTCNVRPYIKDGTELDQYLGAYFSALMVNTKISPNAQFWDIVNAVSVDLRDKLKGENPLRMLRTLMAFIAKDEIYDSLADVADRLPGGRHRDLVFTNLGNLRYLDRDATSNVKLTARYGASAEHTAGAVFAHNIATFSGKMYWTFVYYTHVTSKSQTQKYAESTVAILLEAMAD